MATTEITYTRVAVLAYNGKELWHGRIVERLRYPDGKDTFGVLPENETSLSKVKRGIPKERLKRAD